MGNLYLHQIGITGGNSLCIKIFLVHPAFRPYIESLYVTVLSQHLVAARLLVATVSSPLHCVYLYVPDAVYLF